MSETAMPVCPRCGKALPSQGALVCPACGALVYGAQLEQLSAEARWQEQFDPNRAVELWQECLRRLPRDSKQYATVLERIDQIRAGPIPYRAIQEPGGMPMPRQDPLPTAILKTGLSMMLSIVVYQFAFGWVGALGFVLLVLVHELGHVFANLYYGLPASPPIFIPFVGAIINLRKAPPNAKVEAVVGIAGPVAGTIGTLGVFAWYLTTHSELALVLSWFGFTINLFNLLPVPPLDGGRVAAAISPWIWVLGLGGLGMMLVDEFRNNREPWLLLIVLLYAMPRIARTLKPSGRSGPYYAIGKVVPVVIGAAYLALLGILLTLRWYTDRHLPKNGMF